MLSFFALLFSIQIAHAQYQQAPPQHAPSMGDFPISNVELHNQKKKDLKNGSTTKIEWGQMPLVRRWLVVVALDQEMNEIVYVGESEENELEIPNLPNGKYWFYADGLSLDRLIGRTDTHDFDVGTSVDNSNNAAPEIIYPINNPLYPPYPRVRLSWKQVENAKSYRVQIWNDSLIKKELRARKLPRARWVTEVKTNWLEIHDVPYASYMYLDEGVYRFDVAPIFEKEDPKTGAKTRTVGRQASSYFEVSQNFWLKRGETIFRFGGTLSPASRYESSSILGNEQTNYSSPSMGVMAEFEWYYRRQWGLGLNGGLDFLSLNPAGNPVIYNMGLDLHHRIFLSDVKNGTLIDFLAGLKVQQFAIVDHSSNPEKVSLPQGFGPRLGIRLIKKYESPVELELRALAMMPSAVFNAEPGAERVFAALNFQAGVYLRYFTSEDFAWWAGLSQETRKAVYSTANSSANTAAKFNSRSVLLGIQFQ